MLSDFVLLYGYSHYCYIHDLYWVIYQKKDSTANLFIIIIIIIYYDFAT